MEREPTLTDIARTLDLHTQMLAKIVEAATAEGSSELSDAIKVLAMRIAEMQEQLDRIEKRLP
jgi:hypothetical protein